MRRALCSFVLLAVSCVPMPDIEPKSGKNEALPSSAAVVPMPGDSRSKAATPASSAGSPACAAGYQPSEEWGCVIGEEKAAQERGGESFRTAKAAAEKLEQRAPRKDTPYKGSIVEVMQAYNADAKAAQAQNDAWNPIADGPSKPWSAVARCRQAESYESLARKLDQADPPAVELFSRQEISVLGKLDKSGREDLVQKASEMRAQRAEQWHKKRDTESGMARQNALFLLSTCVLRGIEERFAHPAIRSGAARLAELEGSTLPGTFAAQVDPSTTRLTGKPWQAGLFTRARKVVDEMP